MSSSLYGYSTSNTTAQVSAITLTRNAGFGADFRGIFGEDDYDYVEENWLLEDDDDYAEEDDLSEEDDYI